MLFNKKIPEAPPISDERRYIAWFIEYSDELAEIRKFFKLAAFVESSTNEALREIAKFPNADALFDRLTELATAYQTKLKPMIDARGGLHLCPPEILGVVANVVLNMAVIEELLKKKYKHPRAIQLLDMINRKV